MKRGLLDAGEAAFAVSDGDRAAAPFVATRRVRLLDHFRVPYAVDAEADHGGFAAIRATGSRSALFWPACSQRQTAAASVSWLEGQTPIRLFAQMLPDHVVQTVLKQCGGRWHRAHGLMDDRGKQLGSIWRSDEGNVFLPFDADEVIFNCWSERYVTACDPAAARRLKRGAIAAYYQLRPLIPRRLQIQLRRWLAVAQARREFPRWPVETCLHDFFAFALSIIASIADEPVPWIAPWPGNYSWALVLTHDVERAVGWRSLDPVLEIEREAAMRSCWNLVPQRDYEVDLNRVRALTAEGFEVGVHGLRHDGRDLESLATLRARLPAIRDAAARWGARGFRSPATHRRWEWMPLLGLDYDSSYPDTDPFEPQAGGCCTWLPFFNEGLVELPVTLPQDHTLFAILRRDDGSAWAEKASFLRAHEGMALINTHPDYLIERRALDAYRSFVDRFAPDPSAWKALPREVSSWWRRRAATSLERHEGSWEAVGPAREQARIELLEGSW